MNQKKDTVAVVLGATGNLGRACAEQLASAGAQVVAVDRSDERLADSYDDWDKTRHLLLGGADLTDSDAVVRLVDAIVERFGRIDVVINTIGAFRGGQPVTAEEPGTWDFLMTVNLKPAVNIARAVVPVMTKTGGGSIINIASRNAFGGAANFAAYSAAKAALLRMTESLADEVKAAGINVNCVVPGTMDTPQNRTSMPDADTTRWVSLEAVADVILFLASPESRAVNGAAIPAYGLS